MAEKIQAKKVVKMPAPVLKQEPVTVVKQDDSLEKAIYIQNVNLQAGESSMKGCAKASRQAAKIFRCNE